MSPSHSNALRIGYAVADDVVHRRAAVRGEAVAAIRRADGARARVASSTIRSMSAGGRRPWRADLRLDRYRATLPPREVARRPHLLDLVRPEGVTASARRSSFRLRFLRVIRVRRIAHASALANRPPARAGRRPAGADARPGCVRSIEPAQPLPIAAPSAEACAPKWRLDELLVGQIRARHLFLGRSHRGGRTVWDGVRNFRRATTCGRCATATWRSSTHSGDERSVLGVAPSRSIPIRTQAKDWTVVDVTAGLHR